MSIATVVTRGFGSFGTIALVVTAGYSIGEAIDNTRIDTLGEFRSSITTGEFSGAETRGEFKTGRTTGTMK